MRIFRWSILSAAFICIAGCFSAYPPIRVHYYEVSLPRVSASAPATTAATALGSVANTSGAKLNFMILEENSQVSFDIRSRWVQLPEQMLSNALAERFPAGGPSREKVFLQLTVFAFDAKTSEAVLGVNYRKGEKISGSRVFREKYASAGLRAEAMTRCVAALAQVLAGL
ncbi:MAG: hypothetical protein PHS41_00395 [Victivallaceae bacterium]|nr:hypothetical protein [Victivallaceae bacterium]